MAQRKILLLVELLIVSAAALVAALITLLGTALVTERTPLLLGAALLVLVVTNWIGYHGVVRQHGTARTRTVPAISTLVLVSIVYVAVLRPAASANRPTPAAVQYWELATGSRIAYVRLEPQTRRHAEPILVLHGGPGVADLAGDAAYFGRIRDLGYTVYVYEQLGTGRSSRLDDPAGYSLTRNATDLEAIRTQIGAQHMILIGHSYGAALAARYIADHGEHVAKLIVVSPGALTDGLTGGEALQARLTPAQTRALYAQVLQPRALLVYTLLFLNARAAHQLAGDAEMDARFGRVYAATAAALHCEPTRVPQHQPEFGFYANQYPQAVPHETPDMLAALRHARTPPTLVVKGSCDYLSWASALEYVAAFHAGPAQIAYLPGAGHNVYQDQPSAFERNVRAFLMDRVVPNRYTDRRVPADYDMGK